MEDLLKNDFTTHYGLPISTIADISISTTSKYFEIEDDANRETKVHSLVGSGTAKYSNINSYNVTIINYDKFVTSLPAPFEQGKGRCDLILETNNTHFLLNELTDTQPKYTVDFNGKMGKRSKAISQLLSSLKLIINVPALKIFVNAHTYRHCCFFNKQSMSPPTIIATTAFNRFNTLVTGGLKMSNPAIEAFNFEFWEYSGNQVYTLQ